MSRKQRLGADLLVIKFSSLNTVLSLPLTLLKPMVSQPISPPLGPGFANFPIPGPKFVALWVRLNVKREIGKFIPHPSFYPCPNISDRFSPQASHFIRIQIFQICIFRRRDEHFSTFISHLYAKETFVNQLRKEKGTS